MSAPARRPSVSVSPVAIAGNQPGSPILGASSPPSLATFGSPPTLSGLSLSRSAQGSRGSTSAFPLHQQQGKALAPFPVVDAPVKILLLENVNTAAVDLLKAQGYAVEEIKKALGEEELINKLKEGSFQAVGIRSKTKITAKVIKECPSVSNLLFRYSLGVSAIFERTGR